MLLMSGALQEIEFDAEDIPIVLDECITCAAIRERIDWLLDGTANGHDQVLFYIELRRSTGKRRANVGGRTRRWSWLRFQNITKGRSDTACSPALVKEFRKRRLRVRLI